jgi:dihydrodipicolinate reductase
VEAVLREHGHEVVIASRGHAFSVRCNVGIDFTAPEAVLSNVAAGARYVVGTTGWHTFEDVLDDLAQRT